MAEYETRQTGKDATDPESFSCVAPKSAKETKKKSAKEKQ